MKLAETAQAHGRFEEACELAEAAASELDAAGDARSAARAYGLVSNTYFQLGGADRMRAALERSLELLEPLPSGAELVETYGRMAALESMSGQSPEVGLEWAQRAVSLGEELGLRRELVRPYQWRGVYRCELGDLEGIEDLEHALAEADALRMVVIPAYVNLADQVWRQRGPAAALEIQTEAIEVATKRGGRPTWPQGESCWMLYDLGRWDELLEVAESIRRVEEAHGAAQPGAMAGTYAALVLIQRGALDEGANAAENMLALARRIEDPQVLGPAVVASGLVAQAQGDRTSAVRSIAEYRRVTRNRPYLRAQNLTDAARIACGAGEVALADSLLDNVVTAAKRDRLSALTVRATIDEDATAYVEAAAGWKALGCPLEHALALVGAGRHAEAAPILEELGVPLPPAQIAARTAK
jgi:tetratricopeptide (TPR) repeat protein